MSVLLNSAPDTQGKTKRALLAERLRKAAETTIPLSFAQQRLWFLDQLVPGNAFYNVDSATRMNMGPNDVPLLKRSLNEIVRRHESLRTTFQAVDGEPLQVIAPSLQLPLEIVDLQPLPAPQREAQALPQRKPSSRLISLRGRWCARNC